MSNTAERMPSGPSGPAHTWRPGYACLRKGHAVWALWLSHTRAHTHAQVMNARSLRLSVCGGVLNQCTLQSLFWLEQQGRCRRKIVDEVRVLGG